MKKVTIVIELVDNKSLNVTGPLEDDRQLCVQMLEEALKVAKNYKGGSLLIQGPGRLTELSREHFNHQIRQKL